MWTVSTYKLPENRGEKSSWEVQRFSSLSMAAECAAEAVLYFGAMNVILARVISADVQVIITPCDEGESSTMNTGTATGGLKRILVNELRGE